MKTTIDIVDDLLQRAKDVAARDGTTVRELTEQGLRRILAEREAPVVVSIRPVTVAGEGLRPELEEADWSLIRSLAYEDRGG